MNTLGLGIRSFLLFIGFQCFVMCIAISIFSPFPFDIDLDIYIRGLLMGIMWGLAAPLIITAIAREEVSRAAPIFQSYPLLVVLLAVVFLGENLSQYEFLAVMLAIGGAVLSALKFTDNKRVKFSEVTLYLVVAIVLVSISQILLKTVTDDLSFWHALVFRYFGMAIVLMLLYLRKSYVAEIYHFMKKPYASFALTIDVGAAVSASALLTYAIAKGPVSLASAVVSASPLIVFFMSVLVAAKTPWLATEQLGQKVLVQKFIATLMVVTGLTVLAVSSI